MVCYCDRGHFARYCNDFLFCPRYKTTLITGRHLECCVYPNVVHVTAKLKRSIVEDVLTLDSVYYWCLFLVLYYKTATCMEFECHGVNCRNVSTHFLYFFFLIKFKGRESNPVHQLLPLIFHKS